MESRERRIVAAGTYDGRPRCPRLGGEEEERGGLATENPFDDRAENARRPGDRRPGRSRSADGARNATLRPSSARLRTRRLCLEPAMSVARLVRPSWFLGSRNQTFGHHSGKPRKACGQRTKSASSESNDWTPPSQRPASVSSCLSASENRKSSDTSEPRNVIHPHETWCCWYKSGAARLGHSDMSSRTRSWSPSARP